MEIGLQQTGVTIGLPLALLGGYLFVTLWFITRAWSWQLSGHRLYFAYATAGAFWLIVARIVQVLFSDDTIVSLIDTMLPILCCFAVVTLALGIIAHTILRFHIWSNHPGWFSVIGIVAGSTLSTSAVAYSSNLSNFMSLFGWRQLVIGVVLSGLAIATIAPWYRERVVRIKPQGQVHRILLEIVRPGVKDMRYQGWAVASFRIGLAVAVITVGMLSAARLSSSIEAWWFKFAPIENLGVFALAFSLAIISALILNTLANRDVAKDYSVRHGYEDKLEGLIWESQRNDRLVQFDLENGKVYIGWVLRAPANYGADQSYIEVLPLYSGFRDDLRHELILTSFYHEVFSPNGEKLDFARRKILGARFKKAIDLSRVVSATKFYTEIYRDFTKQRLAASGKKQVVPKKPQKK